MGGEQEIGTGEKSEISFSNSIMNLTHTEIYVEFRCGLHTQRLENFLNIFQLKKTARAI